MARPPRGGRRAARRGRRRSGPGRARGRGHRGAETEAAAEPDAPAEPGPRSRPPSGESEAPCAPSRRSTPESEPRCAAEPEAGAAESEAPAAPPSPRSSRAPEPDAVVAEAEAEEADEAAAPAEDRPPASRHTADHGWTPFVGLTGGLGAGKSTALAALERLGAATLSTDAVVHELYSSDEMRDAVVARWGDEVAPGGGGSRGGRPPRVRRSGPSGSGSRADLAARRRAGGGSGTRRSPGATRARRARSSSTAAVRGRAGGRLRRDDRRRGRRGLRAARAAARGHEAVDERTARQLTQDEKAQRATFVVHNDGTSTISNAHCRRFCNAEGVSSRQAKARPRRHDRLGRVRARPPGARARRGASPPRRRAAVRRRRIGAVVLVAVLAGLATVLVRPVFEDAREAR